jgi:hypothetical protein
MTVKDMVGRVFGRWTVIDLAEGRSSIGYLLWLCKCKCGSIRIVCGNNLRSGNSKSCGCIKSEIVTQRNYKHGLTYTAEYGAWSGLRSRCANLNDDSYGGRGIKVCKRWNSFEKFYADMGPKPSPQHTIERVNNRGNYEPSNCVWATAKVQANNKRNVPRFSYKGQTKSVAEWAAQIGIHPETLRSRLVMGWSLERALTTRPRKLRRSA